ncbi:MAG TPA: hypothetical protein VJN39_03040, partial [Gemmatimonadales bacterium]|nr:hypothetical protein [Gemmatimonadales bacterium]
MNLWLAMGSALAGGAAAGLVFYVVGRGVERRVAEAAAHAAAAESERQLGEARQHLVLTAKEELLRAREAFEEEAARRRADSERRER